MKSNLVLLNLKRLFYTVFIIQAILFVSFAFQWIVIATDSIVVPIALERYTLLITLLGIPGALKLFSVIMKKKDNLSNDKNILSLYRKAFLARFGILFFIASLNIILYAFSFNQNFMLCTLITFTAYLFSYPSAAYIEKAESKEKTEKEEIEKEEQQDINN